MNRYKIEKNRHPQDTCECGWIAGLMVGAWAVIMMGLVIWAVW